MRGSFHVVACGVLAVSIQAPLHADFTLLFSNGDSFDGDRSGDSAGPFLDPETNVTFLVNTAAIGGAGTSINTTAGDLGIAGGANHDRFDGDGTLTGGESWTFHFGAVPIDLTGVDFGLFTGGETFALSSPAWSHATFDAPGSAVTFAANATSGMFTFSNHGGSDIFTASDLTSSGSVSVGGGTHLTLTYTGSDANGAVLEGLTVQANPEPSTLILAGVGCCVGAAAWWRRRRKKKSSDTSAATGNPAP